MLTFSRALLIIALLVASTLARSEGIYNPTAGGWFSFTGGAGGSGGISNASGGGAVATPCSGTGLAFNVACNSQYIGII
jgi:hypothetical protein